MGRERRLMAIVVERGECVGGREGQRTIEPKSGAMTRPPSLFFSFLDHTSSFDRKAVAKCKFEVALPLYHDL
jgi:hypothetical protein